MERTHENGTLRLANAGEKVTLVGWVAKRRNLGSLVFIDLRDRSGIVQLTFDESIAGKKARDSAVSILKHVYGEHLIILNSIDQIEENERNILLQLRDQYISKK